MNKQTVEMLSKTEMDSAVTVRDEKKKWLKPALERFDINSTTQDSEHAAAMS